MKSFFTAILIFCSVQLFAQDEPFFRNFDPANFQNANRSSLNLPSNFILTEFTNFHTNPMDIEFHPDGDKMVVAERAGLFWLYNLIDGEWVREDTPFLDIRDQVTTYFERGVQKILLDTHFIYVYYTVEESYLFPDLNLEVNDDSATINRISRWEVSWNQNTTVFGEDILIGATPIDGIPSLRGNHNGGGMSWGTDGQGLIYFSTGDSAGGDWAQQGFERGIIPESHIDYSGKYRAQIKSSPNGKVCLIRGWNGTGYQDNPYYIATDQSNWLSRIYDYGYRNAFSLYYDADSDMPLVADVGAGSKEEITRAISDGNAGWGANEGFNTTFFDNGKIDPDTGAPFELIYNNPPILDYGHNGNALTRLNDGEGNPFEDTDNPIEGNSITGGVVLKEGFGDYTGFYIFGDYTRGWLNLISPDKSYTENFAPEGTVNATVNITQAPDGSLYIVRLFGGIDRIQYDSTLSLPTVNTTEFNYKDADVVYYGIDGKLIGSDLTYASNGLYIAVYTYKGRSKSKIFVKVD